MEKVCDKIYTRLVVSGKVTINKIWRTEIFLFIKNDDIKIENNCKIALKLK